MKLFLARHAECEKNLIGIPGGSGAALTQVGRNQAQVLAREVGLLGLRPALIVACPTIQTIETAQIVSDEIQVPVVESADLRSIHLGVLAGLPISQARLLHPASSFSMDEWRAGTIELCDLQVEDMEDPVSFYCRGVKYVLDYIQRQETELIIATTSILILMQNLNEMKGASPGEGYRTRDYGNGRLVELEFSSSKIDWLKAQAKKHAIV
ncbi:broad specificity phosphatase PhoE [Bradyrhizobium sp. CIR48]|uniref:histidine phosphatase family protein n=1 Tax=Bradyrhizobium sp. CIR48 TaxID=2663840 RepID=UPI001605ADEE|nr:histidine phosphatase family protein [Bradyrhizobium sp. CIR48]MBB4422207.1 broad specificity phosphatase PhoE [Bradyrhizobium sp. CIR48]